MATFRENPYGAFNYLVSLGVGDEASVVAGFSDVSGISEEISYSDYRNGNEKFNTVRKVANAFKNDDVTLKRGLVGSLDLFEWFKRVREGGHEPRQVNITLMDEGRQPVVTFRLKNAQPKKWVGPTLAAKGGGEVAMEELHLVHEGVDYE